MKSVISKAVLMICALVLIISLAACGAKDNAEETTASTEAAAASSATEAPAPAATDAAVIETEAQASADTGLVGSWDYAELSGIVYTFNADGTGTYDLLGEVMKFTYEADGSALKLQYIDEGVDAATELEYEIDGDTLNVKDSLGNDTIYKRK